MPSCLIAVPDEDLLLTEIIGGTKDITHVATIFSRDEVISAALDLHPDVCILSSELPGSADILDLTESLVQHGVRIIFLASNLSPNNPTIISLVQYGVTDILYGPVTSGLLVERILARGEPEAISNGAIINEIIEKDKRQLPVAKMQDRASEFAKSIGQIIKKKDEAILSNLIVIWSQYSVGRTFITANLCAILGLEGVESILVDRADGPAWIYVGAPEGEVGLDSYFQKDESLQASIYPVQMVPGFFVLTKDPMLEQTTVSISVRDIERLAAAGIMVIVNVGSDCSILEKAAAVIVVTDHDYNGLVKLQKAMDKEAPWHERMILCLNRDSPSQYLQDWYVEQVAGRKVSARIPDYGIKAVESQRAGIPLVLTDQDAAGRFRELASVIERQLEENTWIE